MGVMYVDCDFYHANEMEYWPHHCRCYFNGIDLSIKNRNTVFKFEACTRQKIETTSVLFNDCNTVEYIPIDIINYFNNANGLVVFRSKIPIIRTNLFTVDLKKLQYLSLESNKIKQIEANAFSNLTELKWMCLKNNEIEEIPFEIFDKNTKLEFIDLSNNKISLLHPKLFDNLKNFKEIRLWSKIHPANIKRELNHLFMNYVKKYIESTCSKFLVNSLQKEIEELKVQLKEKDETFSKEITDLSAQLRTLKKEDTMEISNELLQNYVKLETIDGDITIIFPDGGKLKAHKAVLIGNFNQIHSSVRF
jgi:hypothetical protein